MHGRLIYLLQIGCSLYAESVLMINFTLERKFIELNAYQ